MTRSRNPTLRRVPGRPQLSSQEVKNRCYRQHNSIHFKFPRGCVRENPDDGDNREGGHDFHSGKVEGLSAVGAHVALDQKPAGGAAEQIHQEDGDVGKHRQFFERSGDGQGEGEHGVGDDGDVGRAIARMDVREPLRQRAVAAEGEDHSRRTEDVARDETEGGDGCAGEQNSAPDVPEKFRGGFGQRRVFVIGKIDTESSLRHELDENVDDGGDDEREIRRARYGARRIFHFAARNQRNFDSHKGEDQQDNSVA